MSALAIKPRHTPDAARPNRARRRANRTMHAARTPVRHVTLPFCVTANAEPLAGETIGAFLTRTKWATRYGKAWSFRLPTVCVVNGQPVLQRAWKRRRIKSTDVVEFWSRPWGKSPGAGSGKQIAGIVALIALAAFAPWAGGVLATTAFATSLGLSASSITGVIAIGGALQLAPLMRPKLSRWQHMRAWFRAGRLACRR